MNRRQRRKRREKIPIPLTRFLLSKIFVSLAKERTSSPQPLLHKRRGGEGASAPARDIRAELSGIEVIILGASASGNGSIVARSPGRRRVFTAHPATAAEDSPRPARQPAPPETAGPAWVTGRADRAGDARDSTTAPGTLACNEEAGTRGSASPLW